MPDIVLNTSDLLTDLIFPTCSTIEYYPNLYFIVGKTEAQKGKIAFPKQLASKW